MKKAKTGEEKLDALNLLQYLYFRINFVWSYALFFGCLFWGKYFNILGFFFSTWEFWRQWRAPKKPLFQNMLARGLS